METNRRYVSVRLYSDESKPEITENVDTNTIIFNGSNNLGVSHIIIESKRKQYADSSIYLSRRDSVPSLFLLSNTAGIMVYCGAVWINLDNWKSWVLFGVALMYVGLKIWQAVYPMIVRYWNQDDTIS